MIHYLKARTGVLFQYPRLSQSYISIYLISFSALEPSTVSTVQKLHVALRDHLPHSAVEVDVSTPCTGSMDNANHRTNFINRTLDIVETSAKYDWLFILLPRGIRI